MPNRNVHEVMGHLGRDPEVQYTFERKPYCKITIATSNAYKDRDTGEWVERPADWHYATIWGDLAEKVALEFEKGSAIMIRGKSRTKEYQNNEGEKKRSTEITVSEVFKPIYVTRKEKGSFAPEDRPGSGGEWPLESDPGEFSFPETGEDADIPF